MHKAKGASIQHPSWRAREFRELEAANTMGERGRGAPRGQAAEATTGQQNPSWRARELRELEAANTMSQKAPREKGQTLSKRNKRRYCP